MLFKKSGQGGRIALSQIGDGFDASKCHSSMEPGVSNDVGSNCRYALGHA